MKFYIGITTCLEQRIHYHNNGRSPYTRGKGPWHLVFSEKYESRGQALRREREIKDWRSSKRIIKELMINVKTPPDSNGPVVTG